MKVKAKNSLSNRSQRGAVKVIVFNQQKSKLGRILTAIDLALALGWGEKRGAGEASYLRERCRAKPFAPSTLLPTLGLRAEGSRSHECPSRRLITAM